MMSFYEGVQTPEDDTQEGSAPSNYGEALRSALSANPSLGDMRIPSGTNAREVVDQPPLWRRILSDVGETITSPIETSKAVLRGATRAVDEAFEFATEDVGANFLKLTGAYKLFNDEQGEEDWLTWYEQRHNLETALMGEERRQRWLGTDDATVSQSIIEGISQFVVGFAGLGKVKLARSALALRRIPGGIRAARALRGPISGGMIRGAGADFAVFDPHEQRISNMVERGPEWLRNPVTAYLASNEDDSAWEGRFKNMLEGSIMGAAIDGLFLGLRATKRSRAGKELQSKGKHEEAQAMWDEAMELAEQASRAEGRGGAGPDDVFAVTEAADGRAAIVDAGSVSDPAVLPSGREGDLTMTIPEGTIKVRTMGNDWQVTTAAAARKGEGLGEPLYERMAQELARRGGRLISAAGNNRSGSAQKFWERMVKKGKAEYDEANDLFAFKPEEPKGKPAEGHFDTEAEAMDTAATLNADAREAERAAVDPNDLDYDEWRREAKEMAASTDPDDIARIAKGSRVALPYYKTTRENRALIEALAEQARNLSPGRTRAELVALADGILPGMDGEEMIEALARTFGDTKNLDAHILATRRVLVNMVGRAKEAAIRADRNPGNAMIASSAEEKFSALIQVYEFLTGTSSNLGRGMEAHQVPLGARDPGAPAGARKAATAHDNLANAREFLEDAKAQNDAEALDLAMTEYRVALEDAVEATGGKMPPRRKAKAADEAQAELGLEAEPTPAPRTADELLEQGRPVEDFLARSTKSFEELQIKESKVTAPAGRAAVEGLTAKEIREMMRWVFLADEGNPEEILGQLLVARKKLARRGSARSKPRDWMDHVIQYRVSMMLSSPKTQVINITNNAIVSLTRPVEYWWAGHRSGDNALQQAGSDLFVGLWQAMGDSWKMARKAFKTGDQILDPGSVRGQRGLEGVQLGLPHSIGEAYQQLISMPGRFLVAGDELFSQLNYRANSRMQLLKKARELGVADDDIGDFLADHMKWAFDEEGAGTIPMAMQYAREQTFKQELRGPFKAIESLANQFRFARWLVPFIRTPANLLTYAGRRTPGVQRLVKSFKEDLAAGGERAAIAKAQQELGIGFVTSVAGLSAMGWVTGAGPQDPETRRQWREVYGFRPHSFYVPNPLHPNDRTKGTWISYRKGDPLMMSVGIVSDLVQMGFDMDDATAGEVLSGVALSVGSGVSSKAFLQGVTEFLDAVHSGEQRKLEVFVSSTVRSLIPAAVRGTNDFISYERETNSLMQRIQRAVPGWGMALEPRRNAFGEVVMAPPNGLNRYLNPFQYNSPQTAGHQVLVDEIMGLGRNFSMPPKKMRTGEEEIDLTRRGVWNGPDTPNPKQSPYNRQLELMDTPLIGGKSFRDALLDLVQSEQWTKLQGTGEETAAPGGIKWMLVSGVYQSYQQAAMAQVYAEYPGILRERTRLANLKAAELGGNSEAVERLRGLAP
jgi:hypothetical protein